MWYNARMAGQERSDVEKIEIDRERIRRGLNPLWRLEDNMVGTDARTEQH